MKKKILALCLVVVLVATAITGVTLAYFTDKTDVAINTFTVGDVDIKLDETDTDESTPNADRDIKNEYPDIYPNQTVVKDPMVTFVKDSRDCYVRMLVTVDYDKLVAAFPKDDPDFADLWADELFLLEKLVVDENGNCTWDRNKWEIQNNVTVTEGKATYEFRFHEKLVAPAANTTLDPLFTKITFPAAMTNAQILALDNFQVDVVAHAMQAEGFANQDAAWAAWTATGDDNLSTRVG